MELTANRNKDLVTEHTTCDALRCAEMIGIPLYRSLRIQNYSE